MLGSMVTIMTSSFTKQEQFGRVEEFFANKNTNGFDQSLAQSKDAIHSKIAWIKRDGSDVAEWVKFSDFLEHRKKLIYKLQLSRGGVIFSLARHQPQ